jgi:hypothetical protein
VNLPAIFDPGRGDQPLVLRTTLSQQDISWNLHKRANDWRDSAIPDELQKIGIDKLVLEGEGDEFSLEWGGRTNPVNNPALFLTIVRLPDGGSEVTARFGRGTLRVFALLLLLTTPLQAMTEERGPMRWFFLAASLAVSLGFLITGKSNTPHLKAQLIKVVERATHQKAEGSGSPGLSGTDTVPRLSP